LGLIGDLIRLKKLSFNLFGEFVTVGATHLWLESKSGVAFPHEAPAFLFRGE
jgi:hypothetical protein